QNASRIFTSVNGTGRSLTRGASSAASGARPLEARHTRAMKCLIGSILNSVSIGNREPHPDPSGLARSRGYVERSRSLDRVSGPILPPPRCTSRRYCPLGHTGRPDLLLKRPAAVGVEVSPPVRSLAFDLGVQRLEAFLHVPESGGLFRL